MTDTKGSFKTIVADPPWPIKWGGGKGGRRRRSCPLPYDTMSVGNIAALDSVVKEWADPEGCHLYLWATEEMYRSGRALEVMETWGFRYVGTIIWRKPNFGMGAFPRPGHEPCLVGRRGDTPFARRDVHSVQTWKQPHGGSSPGGGKQHSAKPDGFFDLVESASPGPYLETFSRRARFNWQTWGNESLEGGAA